MNQPKYTCANCESEKEPYFSRSEPMGFFCVDCGRNFDEKDFAAELIAWENKWQCAAEMAAQAEADLWETKQQLAAERDLLLDPHAVYINMLHGKIAKLDWQKLEHINGPHPLRDQLAAERALADRLAEILQLIANEDYRGNRPHHCVVAYCGVKEWKEARSECR